MGGIREIANNDLALTDIPDASAEWHDIELFALTFNGYQFEDCAEIANSRRNDTLTDMRTCLFFEQRRWRHLSEYPDDETMEYIHRLLEKIRDCVAAGNV